MPETYTEDELHEAIKWHVANAVEDERARIAAWLPSQPITLKMLGLTGLAKCIARGDHAKSAATPREVETRELAHVEVHEPGDGLPPHRDGDDFADGVHLVQGGRFMRGVTGRLRDKD